jgi:hypothetical protein
MYVVHPQIGHLLCEDASRCQQRHTSIAWGCCASVGKVVEVPSRAVTSCGEACTPSLPWAAKEDPLKLPRPTLSATLCPAACTRAPPAFSCGPCRPSRPRPTVASQEAASALPFPPNLDRLLSLTVKLACCNLLWGIPPAAAPSGRLLRCTPSVAPACCRFLWCARACRPGAGASPSSSARQVPAFRTSTVVRPKPFVDLATLLSTRAFSPLTCGSRPALRYWNCLAGIHFQHLAIVRNFAYGTHACSHPNTCM